MQTMQVAIMAGGKGTRIAEYYPDLPKPMVPLCGKPILQHQVELLVGQGFCDITLIVGYMAEKIVAYFGDGSRFGARITYITEDTPLGTGGALALLPKQDVLLLMGDVYLDVDFGRFISYHRSKNAAIALFAHPNSHPWDSDILVTDAEGRVLAWSSKKEENRGELRNLVNAGLYILSAATLPPTAEKLDLDKGLVAPRVTAGDVYAYRSTEYVKDMGTPQRLQSVSRDIEAGVPAARVLSNRQKAVFLDRDGVINEYLGFLTKPEQMKLLPGAAEAIHLLNTSQYLAICVTNQPVIARGDVAFDGLEIIHARLDTLLAREAGAYLDDLYFCPHHPHKGYEGEVPELKIDCACRKPKPGMLLDAARRYHIDLHQSFMLGDSAADIEAGQAAGCRSFGILTGKALADMAPPLAPEHTFPSLLDTVRAIVENAV